jgi:hypothetical protein
MHTVLLSFRFPGVADPQDPAIADDGIVQEHPSDRIIAQMTARSWLQTFINVLYEDGTP